MCLRPLTIKNPNYFDEPSAPSHLYANSRNVYGRSMEVPCGKCLECVRHRQNQLSWLAEQENKHHSYPAAFVTLTYDDAHLPKQHIVRQELDTETGEIFTTEETVPTCCKRHVQNFLKRLRKELNDPLRVIWCTEYGSKFHRPHVHLILFNQSYTPNLLDTLQKCWSTPKRSKYDIPERLGFVYLDSRPAGIGSLKYLAKYSFKPSASKDNDLDPLRPYTEWEKRYVYCAENPDGFIEKPVARHSIRLGYNYLFNDDGSIKDTVYSSHRRVVTNSLGRSYLDDSVCYGTTKDGKPIMGRLPDSLARKVYTSSERFEQYLALREESFFKQISQFIRVYNNENPQNPTSWTAEKIILSLRENHCVPQGAMCLFSESLMVKMAHLAEQEKIDSERQACSKFIQDVNKSLF